MAKWNVQPLTRIAPFRAEVNQASDPLAYIAPPRTVHPKTPEPEELTRYFVYHPTIANVGSAPVVEWGSYRVVYLTAEAASNYLSAYLIGRVPWSALSYDNRKFLSQFSGGAQPADRAPVVVGTGLANQSAMVGTGKSYQFATNIFVDPDNSSAAMTYSAYKSGGDPLPSWWTFTGSNRTFSGTAQTGNQGTYVFTVKATDPWGQYATANYTLTVT